MGGRRRNRREGSRDQPRPGLDRGTSSSLRVAVGLGDPERERGVLAALGGMGEVVIAARCLSADELVSSLRQGQVDVALVAFDLHRLSASRLEELVRSRVPLVLLAPESDHDTWHTFPGVLLPLRADPDAVHAALLAAVRGERHHQPQRHEEARVQPAAPASFVRTRDAALHVIAVASGPGSPGRTTVALNLAAALGAVAPTILVDADMAGPSIAASLDADPTRNLSMLVHAEPATARDWDRALSQEVQPLAPRSPHGLVLCGIPKPEMRSAIPPRFVEQLIAELRQRYRYVLLDIGADLLSPDVTLHRVALGFADQILLVVSPDLLGLWRARTALGQLQTAQQAPGQVALVLNQYDRHYHHARREIEWALGLPTAAVVPYDYRAVQRALAAQRPLVLDRGSRAGRALLQLAERVHGGSVVLPPEAAERQGMRWRLQRPRLGWRRTASTGPEQQGVPDGDYATPLS